MEFNTNKNSNNTQNKNNEEKYNEFNVEIYDNQKNNQQEENKNNISNTQQIDKNIKNEKEEDNEIIIELEIKNSDDKEINILCDKDKLIEDNTRNEKFYKQINREPPKIFDFFN